MSMSMNIEHEEDGVTSDAEAGPDFHVDERVLCTDARRAGAGAGTTTPFLYEAIVRRSDVKYVRDGMISELRAPRDGDHVKKWCHLVQ